MDDLECHQCFCNCFGRYLLFKTMLARDVALGAVGAVSTAPVFALHV